MHKSVFWTFLDMQTRFSTKCRKSEKRVRMPKNVQNTILHNLQVCMVHMPDVGNLRPEGKLSPRAVRAMLVGSNP